MSANEQIRAMIDGLMGTSSQGGGESRKFTDSLVCKPYLLHCCVNEIFEATRLNIGVCKRIHDVRLRSDFERAQASKDLGYDLEVRNYLQSFLADRDRRVASAKQKLAETQENFTKPSSEKETVLEELKSKLEEKIKEAERLGEQGLVEDSLKVMEEVTELTNKKKEAEQEFRNAVPPLSYQQQEMRVCEVCTSLLGAHDNDKRLADHFGGKLHLGYLSVQTKFEELQERVSKQSGTRSDSSEEDERHERRRRVGRDRNRNRRGYHSRSRSRSREHRHGSNSRYLNSGYTRSRHKN